MGNETKELTRDEVLALRKAFTAGMKRRFDLALAAHFKNRALHGQPACIMDDEYDRLAAEAYPMPKVEVPDTRAVSFGGEYRIVDGRVQHKSSHSDIWSNTSLTAADAKALGELAANPTKLVDIE